MTRKYPQDCLAQPAACLFAALLLVHFAPATCGRPFEQTLPIQQIQELLSELPAYPNATVPTSVRLLNCTAKFVFRPDNTTQLAKVIKTLVTLLPPGQLNIRATAPISHSSATFTCPKQYSNTTNNASSLVTVTIDTSGLKKTLLVDKENGLYTVQAGIQLIDLQRRLQALGWSLPSQTYPIYSGLSLGGVLSSSAHGSIGNDPGSDTLLNSIVKVTLVDGKGDTHRGVDPSLIFGSFGLMGVVTDVTIRPVPAFKTQMTVRHYSDDNITAILQAEVDAAATTEGRNFYVWWLPSKREFTVYEMRTVPADTPGEGYKAQFTLLNEEFARDLPLLLGAEALNPLGRDDLIGCQIGSTLWLPFYENGTNAGLDTPVVGWSWAMQASGCQWLPDGNGLLPDGTIHPGGCRPNTWDIMQHYDSEFVVPASLWPDVVEGTKHIVRTAMPHFANGSCMTPMLVRWGRRDSRTLTALNSPRVAPGAVDPDPFVLYIGQPWVRPNIANLRSLPQKYNWLVEEWEQMMACTYSGRPHWGKNNDRSFSNPRCPVRDLYPGFDQLLKVKKGYDPLGVMEPTLFKKVVQRASYELTPNCASDQACYCETDEQCPVGYECVPGRAFPQYLVCRPKGFCDVVKC